MSVAAQATAQNIYTQIEADFGQIRRRVCLKRKLDEALKKQMIAAAQKHA